MQAAIAAGARVGRWVDPGERSTRLWRGPLFRFAYGSGSACLYPRPPLGKRKGCSGRRSRNDTPACPVEDGSGETLASFFQKARFVDEVGVADRSEERRVGK